VYHPLYHIGRIGAIRFLNMQDYQREFLRFAVAAGALRFGDFTLKSGRRSPYFFNAGRFDTGAGLARLAHAYARRIADAGIAFDVLYGPAYKGIPLAAATSIALAQETGRDCPYAFNRKEAKDHGEGGVIVGRALAGRVLIVDDVITAGHSIRESIDLIRGAGAQPVGVVIALDRQERGADERSAVDEVQALFGVPVFSIVTLDHLIGFLDRPAVDGGADDTLAVDDALRAAVRSYRVLYGV
jgi:orotate phosphoribosyltransferase